MKKSIFIWGLFFGGILLFSACDPGVSEPEWGKTEFFRVIVGECSQPADFMGDRVNDDLTISGDEDRVIGASGVETDGDCEELYFEYPSEAVIDEIVQFKSGKIGFGNCELGYGFEMGADLNSDKNIQVEKIEDEGVVFAAVYDQRVLGSYYGYQKSTGFGFGIKDGSEEYISQCIPFVDQLAKSISDKPLYKNDRFGFRVALLPDYKFEKMPSREGVIMKKWAEAEVEIEDELVEQGYGVEIAVFGQDNIMNYKNLAEFIEAEYSGFSTKFVTYGSVLGVYIDEGMGDSAVKHFYTLSDDIGTIFEGTLKTPSQYHGEHWEDFETVMKSFRVL